MTEIRESRGNPRTWGGARKADAVETVRIECAVRKVQRSVVAQQIKAYWDAIEFGNVSDY